MPSLFMMSEGHHVDHFGNLICPIYVDFRDPSERQQITRLVKGCRKAHAIETGKTVLISKPSRFRDLGENLIRDPGEAHASQDEVPYEATDDPGHLADARRRDQVVNRAHELVGSNVQTNTTSVHRTGTNTRTWTFGKNGWIFCASIEPTTPQEWELWRGTLENDYDHVSYIRRPREFARALATMSAEQEGPQSQSTKITHSFEGEPKLRTEHAVQLLYHGPVIYVDDVYGLIDAATSKHEFMLLPLFAKATKYRDQREYRFAVFADEEPTTETVFLAVSPAMAGTISRETSNDKPQIMPTTEYLEDELHREHDDIKEEKAYGSYQPDGSPAEKVIEDSEGLYSLRQQSFDQPNNQATVFRPNKLDPAVALPEDFSSLTATYSGVQALRNMVNFVHITNDLPLQRKLETGSAAWYAEQHIRSLCQTLDDPISGVSISTDNYVVVEVSLHDRPDIECRMAVSPTGHTVLQLTVPTRRSTVVMENTSPPSNAGQTVRRFLEETALPMRLNDGSDPEREVS